MAAVDGNAVARFRDALTSAVASGDRRAFDRATVALARDTRSTISDVLSAPALQGDVHVAHLLSLAADLQWINPPKTWASVIKHRTHANASSSVPLTLHSQHRQRHRPHLLEQLEHSSPLLLQPQLQHQTQQPQQPQQPQQQQQQQQLQLQLPQQLIPEHTQQAYQHWEGGIKAPIIGRIPRAHYVTNMPTGRALLPIVTAQNFYLPTALRVTPTGARASFRAWKWHRNNLPNLPDVTPSTSTPSIVSTDATIGPTTPTTTVAATAAVAAAAAAATMATSRSPELGDMDIHLGNLHAVGTTSRNSPEWHSNIDLEPRVDPLMPMADLQESMRPAIAATEAALEALSPFLARSERAQLRQAVAATTPLDGLGVVLNAARAACREGFGLSDTDVWSDIRSGIEASVSQPLRTAERRDNSGMSSNILGSTSSGWINNSSWNGSMWQNDGREVAWRAPADGMVPRRNTGTSSVLPTGADTEANQWNVLSSSVTSATTANVHQTSKDVDMHYGRHACQ